MKKEIFFTSILVVIFIFLAPLMVSLGVREVPKSAQKSFGDHKKIYGEVNFKTNIESLDSNLLAVGLSFRNFNLINKKDTILVLFENGLEVRRAIVNGASISDGGFVKFKFAPISESKGKEYQINISSKDSSEDDALQVFFDSSGADLNYQLFYKPRSLSVVTTVYSNWVDKLMSDKLFVGIYAITLLVFGVGLLKKDN